MSNDATPAKVRLSAGLGQAPERGVSWLLAVEVARGRMPGGWVPVDADLVLAVNARMAALEGWLEGDCTCPCCQGVRECLPGCTFADDCPDDHERMAGAREALFEV